MTIHCTLVIGGGRDRGPFTVQLGVAGAGVHHCSIMLKIAAYGVTKARVILISVKMWGLPCIHLPLSLPNVGACHSVTDNPHAGYSC